jgi:hypothetical protein
MEVGITTTHTPLSEGVTGLSRLTYMFLGVLQRLRLCSMEYSSCRRRLTGGGTFFIGGLNDQSNIYILGLKLSPLIMFHSM